jgi:hypothetical protein
MTDALPTAGIAAAAWTRTIKGRPSVGGVAERTRRTSMRDVTMFSEMTGDGIRFTSTPFSPPDRPLVN